MHNIKYIVVIIFCLMQTNSLRAEYISYEDAVKLRKEGENAEAKKAFESLVKKNDKDADSWLQLGIIQRQQQEFEAALKSQTKVLELNPKNADAKLELARIYNWYSELDKAEALVKEVLVAYPDYKEAEILEANILRNKRFRINAERYKWAINVGYEESNFQRITQPNWYTSFIQLGHWVTPETLIFARAENEERRDINNDYYELGLVRIFNEVFNGQFSVGKSTDALFKPVWSFKTAGSARIIHNNKILGDTWLIANIKQDHYKDLIITTYKPGLSYSISDNLQIQGRYVYIVDNNENNKDLSGWETRLTWQTPLEKLRIFGGLSEAPESEDSKEVTTKSYFTGFSFAINSQVTIITSYTREDREDSFIRQIGSIALSVKF